MPFINAWLLLGLLSQTIDPVARDTIAKAQRAQAESKGFRVAIRTTDAAGTHTTELVFVAPDRYHSRETSGDMRIEHLRMGSRGWVKTATTPWEPAPFDVSMVLRHLSGPPRIIDADVQLQSARTRPAVKGPLKHEYVIVFRGNEWRIRMSTVDGRPVEYDADAGAGIDRESYTWSITYDDSLSVEEPQIATSATCSSGAECLTLGRRRVKPGAFAEAAPFYRAACDRGAWEGCYGYATYLWGVGYAAREREADRLEAAREGLQFIDRAITLKADSARAHLYRGLLLRLHMDYTLVKEADAAAATARKLLAIGPDSGQLDEDTLATPPPPPPPPKRPPFEW